MLSFPDMLCMYSLLYIYIYLYIKDSGRKLAGEMKAVFLETSAKDHHCASDIFIKSLIQIEKVCRHRHLYINRVVSKEIQLWDGIIFFICIDFWQTPKNGNPCTHMGEHRQSTLLIVSLVEKIVVVAQEQFIIILLLYFLTIAFMNINDTKTFDQPYRYLISIWVHQLYYRVSSKQLIQFIQ